MARTVLTVIGILCVVLGLLWIGQGMGLIRWPADSFMIDESAWTVRGACVAAVGAGLILLGRWLGRR